MRKSGEMEGGRLHRGAHEERPSEGQDSEHSGHATEPAYDDYGRAFTPSESAGWPGRRTLLTRRPPQFASSRPQAKRRALTETARTIAGSLGLPAEWGQVTQDASAAPRLDARGARGMASAGRIELDAALDATSTEGRRIVAHELVHIAQMRLPAPAGADLTDEAELEADQIGLEYAETGQLRRPVVPLAPSAVAADTGARAVFREADLPMLDARQAFNPLIANLNAQFMQLEALVRSIPDADTAAGAAVIQTTKARYIGAARMSRAWLLNHVPPLVHSGRIEAAGLELSRLMFSAQLMGLFTRVLSVAAFAQASGAPARPVAHAIDELDKLFGKTLDLASQDDPALFRAAVATAPLLVRRVEDLLAAAVPSIAANAEMTRKVMIAVQLASLAVSIYQVWRAPIAGGGSPGGGIAGVSGGGAVIASANAGQLMQLVAAVRQLVAIGALDATLVTAIGSLGGGPQARAEPMQSSGAPPTGGRDTPAERAKRLAELSIDPDKPTGSKSAKAEEEARVMLDLEDAGRIKARVKRPNPATGQRGDFVDGNGQQWDIKAPKNRDTIRREMAANQQRLPPPNVNIRGEHVLQADLVKIGRDIASGEKVVIDLRGLSASEQLTLKNAVTQAGWDIHVLYYP